ncbi:MAG: hypothetical protein PHR77_13475, partial [Kiritimatiellae bacterium]|nr:hypothetical protein [Kiritimatiellia bacterium]
MKACRLQLLSFVCVLSLVVGVTPSSGSSNTLFIGSATIDITPSRPIALAGQFNTRISRSVENPITATAVAIETRDGDRMVDCAVLVSCDIVSFRPTVPAPLQEKLKKTLPGFDSSKVVLTATHTHTSAVTEEGAYKIPKEGVMQPAEYTEFLINKLAEVIGKAWGKRQPGGVSWVLGHAVVGLNRRAVYADGKAKMYGSTTTNSFRGIEGGEDHGLEMLFFWDKDNKPLAVCINVECPSQEVESR